MSLLSLPYELIDTIGRLLTLSELEAFALTSKFIHKVTVPIFEEWGNTFHSLSLPKWEPIIEKNDMTLFLATVLDHPYLRYYPSDVAFYGWQRDPLNVNTLERKSQAEQKLINNFTKLVENCHIDIWSDQLGLDDAQSHISFAACLLFVLLPNVETIKLVSNDDGIMPTNHLDRLKTLVQTIADANQDSTPLCHKKALIRLRSFHFEHDDYFRNSA
ncbi:MAG: hypothetical protein L6R37_005676 [Teloschistes peruensis]|nr:MAG: hypothetical protein L6R37_005676 [Teloschistes peruensis]